MVYYSTNVSTKTTDIDKIHSVIIAQIWLEAGLFGEF